jgi:hypothetical protein
MTDQLTPAEQQAIRRTVARIHKQGWGIAFGLLFAVALLAATNILVVEGGPVIGPHLSLLRWYFPGYSVTFGGSLIGAVYAFVVGYGFGSSIAAIYNRLTKGLR